MSTIVLKAVEMYKKPNRTFLFVSLLVIGLMLCLAGTVVYFTGGTQYAYLHLMYIPITFSAFLFREKGGIFAGLVAGLIVGPLMPLNVENSISQPLHTIMYRTFFFILIGAFVGYMSKWLKIHLIRSQENFNQIAMVYANTLQNYAKMVSARDEQTAYHCERVAYNSQILGHAIGLDEKGINTLYWSGLLHDVGKIGIKEEILLKPGKLTEEEFAEMTRHTVIGHELIHSLSEDLEAVAEGVCYHHEKWDGSGYPDGLKGCDIPLIGRIIAIVDVFEALTSERPYKKAWDPDEAMVFIIKNKGIHFDPELVDRFKTMYDEGKIWISHQSAGFHDQMKPTKFSREMLSKSI